MSVTTVARPIARSNPFAAYLNKLIDSLTGTVGGIPSPAFWRALMDLRLEAGRPLETLARLQWSNIDLDRRCVTFPGGVTRLLSPQLVIALRAIQEPERLLVFPWHGGSIGLQHAMNELTARAAVLAEGGVR